MQHLVEPNVSNNNDNTSLEDVSSFVDELISECDIVDNTNFSTIIPNQSMKTVNSISNNVQLHPLREMKNCKKKYTLSQTHFSMLLSAQLKQLQHHWMAPITYQEKNLQLVK